MKMLRKIMMTALLLCSALWASSQVKTRDSLPYQKYPGLPAFNVLLQDSATVFNTYYVPEGQPTVIVFFSPDCDHCQQTAKAIVAQLDAMKDAHFLFITPMSLSILRPFAYEMKLNGHKNITVGKDYEYFFPKFYGASYVPYVAVYDRKKKFVKMWEGRVKIEDLVRELQAL